MGSSGSACQPQLRPADVRFSSSGIKIKLFNLGHPRAASDRRICGQSVHPANQGGGHAPPTPRMRAAGPIARDRDPSQRHPWGRCEAGTKTLDTQAGCKAMADVAYDAASTPDLTSQVETIRAANHDIFASCSTSDAILPMQAGPEPTRLPPSDDPRPWGQFQ
jgi:hypothetical protein